MIAYYVHHHGAGHLERARAVLGHLPSPTAVLSQLPIDSGGLGPGIDVVHLPPDAPARTSDVEAGGSLHWAPLDVDTAAPRVRAIAEWIDDHRPDLLVVDVSVEVAVLARLLGVPTAVIRLQGDRRDRPHRLAFDCASTIVAPFPAELDDPGIDPELVRRTFYAGVISRGSPRMDLTPTDADTGARSCAVLWGRGGPAPSVDALTAAADATPDWSWTFVGPDHTPCCPRPNLRIVGWVTDVDAQLVGADVVVGAAGNGTIAAAARSGRPFICLPQPRPFDEQVTTSRQLDRLDWAVVRSSWPSPGEWSDLLETASRHTPLSAHVVMDDGAALAKHLTSVADRIARDRSSNADAPIDRCRELAINRHGDEIVRPADRTS